IPACVLAFAATQLAERTPTKRALWLIFGIGIVLRIYVLLFDPLLSSDIFRYVWDGRIQAAGINPYRYFPAHDAVAHLRDATIFPEINRPDYAVTIYPPVAEFFFLIVTRIGENVNVMRLALLGCEVVIVSLIMLFLRRMERPTTRVVAYFWHPLPIWEIANSGHIDALAVALMLLGLWVALTGRVMRGAALIALGVLVKPYVAPALAPVWRVRDWKMPLVVIAIIALCYLPYLSVGWGVFGFLTKGYLTEEGVISGNDLWLLSVWRLVFGAHSGDVVAYAALAISILLLIGLSAARRPNPTIASSLADTNMLLLVVLLLLSPNYPWYFLAIVPFAALCGNAPTWVLSIGALLLTDEARWDFQIPKLVVKSILFGGCLLAYAWSARVAYLKKTADMERSQ
ncbi:MAG TPA: glycosyltransferase family 87 protein, partial [Pseudolabrys sp.]|nr:glycosyltransferase family 87 protein [Pseudolabrys sp.]